MLTPRLRAGRGRPAAAAQAAQDLLLRAQGGAGVPARHGPRCATPSSHRALPCSHAASAPLHRQDHHLHPRNGRHLAARAAGRGLQDHGRLPRQRRADVARHHRRLDDAQRRPAAGLRLRPPIQAHRKGARGGQRDHHHAGHAPPGLQDLHVEGPRGRGLLHQGRQAQVPLGVRPRGGPEERKAQGALRRDAAADPPALSLHEQVQGHPRAAPRGRLDGRAAAVLQAGLCRGLRRRDPHRVQPEDLDRPHPRPDLQAGRVHGRAHGHARARQAASGVLARQGAQRAAGVAAGGQVLLGARRRREHDPPRHGDGHAQRVRGPRRLLDHRLAAAHRPQAAV